MQTQLTPPVAAVVVTHDVESFERWKVAFDRHADARRTAGVLATHINRDADHPNRLSVYMAGSDAARLAAFLKSSDLASTMLDAGVKGPPSVAVVTPIEDRTQKRPLAGAIVRHTVTDYATWKRAFDADAAARTAAGIVGHAVNRSAQDPNTVIVYRRAARVHRVATAQAGHERGRHHGRAVDRVRPWRDLGELTRNRRAAPVGSGKACARGAPGASPGGAAGHGGCTFR